MLRPAAAGGRARPAPTSVRHGSVALRLIPERWLALIVPTSDPRQAVRLRRFLLASSLYAIALPLLAVANALDLIGTGDLQLVAALVLAVNVALYALLRSGVNQRFVDPSLTLMQILAGTGILMYIVYAFERDHGIALVLCPVLLIFGVFRFTTREFIAAAAAMLVAYAGVIVALTAFKPDHLDVVVEWYRWMVLASMLPSFALIGAKSSELRQHLRRSNEELSEALKTIQQMATHDTLTGLPNRALFNETLVHAIAGARRHEWRTALFFMDLDRFKNINDTLGHNVGDRVLMEAARRFVACAGDAGMVARLGGDEFVLLVDEVEDEATLGVTAQAILAAMTPPIVVDGRELALTVSIGVCMFPDDAGDVDTLVSNADIAMYRAKAHGRDTFRFYSPQINVHSEARLSLETNLRHALERDELEMHYQPKIAIASGHLAGVEALLRWRHPQMGILLPGGFMALAEESGLIVPIGTWALRAACRQARAWHDAGLSIPVAVNLSARQFHDGQLAAALAQVLEETSLPPWLLELEITESMVMDDPEQATRTMRALRAMGLKLAMDDFGTGYSSLGYLKRFPLDELKLDRSFIDELPHDRHGIAITRAVIAMAHTLGMSVVAEGVERPEQLAVLRAEGCDQYQGYLCRPALPADALLDFACAERPLAA